jgi:hypothetical protein
MLRFCGFDLELMVEKVLVYGDGPVLCWARDMEGGHWLIAQVDAEPAHLMWLCAPMSERGAQIIVEGQGSPVDALRHSSTGTVEVVTIDHGRAVPDRCLLCAQIRDGWLPVPGRPDVIAA